MVAVGWWHAGTGLTRVAAEILPRLARTRPVDYVGLGHRGPIAVDGMFRVHPCDFEGRDALGAHAAADLARSRQPAVTLAFNDLWFLERYRRALQPVLNGAGLVAYLPLDGEIPDPELVRPLFGFDLLVVYTEWAREQLLGAFAALESDSRGGAKVPRVGVVGHGLDRDTFHPDPDLVAAGYSSIGRTGAKLRIFPNLRSPESSFVLLNASRPSRRKRIDLTLAGFALFLRSLPKEEQGQVYLCLHQAVAGEVHRDLLDRQIADLGLEERILDNPFGSEPVEDGVLNDLYNACDVGINTSTGEGWGLVSCEHAAAGGRQIVPDHSACTELWPGRGILLPSRRRAIFDYSPLRLSEVSPEAVRNGLSEAYDRRNGDDLAAVSRWARSPQFCWQSLAQTFDGLLQPWWSRGLTASQRGFDTMRPR